MYVYKLDRQLMHRLQVTMHPTHWDHAYLGMSHACYDAFCKHVTVHLEQPSADTQAAFKRNAASNPAEGEHAWPAQDWEAIKREDKTLLHQVSILAFVVCLPCFWLDVGC